MTVTRRLRPQHQRPWFTRALAAAGSIPTIGLNIPLSTLVAPFTLPLTRSPQRPPMLRVIVIWSAIGAAAFALSALLNKVELSSSSVGQFMTLAITLLAYRVCIVDSAAAARVVGWLAGTMAIYYVILGPANTQDSFENLWKYGIAYPVTFVVVYMLTLRTEGRAIPFVALALLGAAGMLLGYRSHGLVCFIAAVLVVVKGRKPRNTLGLLLVGVAGITALSIVIPNLVLSGVFGEALRERTMDQSEDGPLILGGRTEPPLSIAIIYRHFWVGIGNAQAIGQGDIDAGVALAQSLGMTNPGAYLPFWIREEGRISLHSVLLTSWVEGGVLAAVMPIMLLVLFVWAAVVAVGRFAPLVVVTAVQGSWDILFSPWVANKSVAFAASAILCMWAIGDRRRLLETSVAPPSHRRTRVVTPAAVNRRVRGDRAIR